MDTAKWPQEASRSEAAAPTISERKIRRRNDIQKQLNCPRCNSNNTKFCYYNNYSLTQPRHFCKTCRRYWTAGGSLRNIPVGGGSRKNKRSLTATSSSAISSSSSMQNPRFDFADQARDLNLGFQQVGGNLMHEVFGFQVGAGAPVKHDEGRILFGSSVARGGGSEQNRGEGGDVQGFWNGMMGNIGGNW